MWTLVYGPIPEGLVVGHSCNNKGCINTNHMYLCTPEANSSDAARDGLYKSGFDHYKSKVSKEDQVAMWEMYHTDIISQEKIAELFNISQSTVSDHIRKVEKDYR